MSVVESGEALLSQEEEILRKNLTSHQFPEHARTHQLRGISTVSHFLNVGQMCRDVRRRTVEGVDPETWYGRVVTSVGGLGGGGKEEWVRRGGEAPEGGRSVGGRTEKRNGIFRNGRVGGKRGRGRSAGLLNGVRDKKQIRFTHSRFPLANSISSGVPLTLCP